MAAGAKSAKADDASVSSRACRLEPAELELLVLLLLLAEDEREMEQNELSAAVVGKGRAVGIEVADEAWCGRAVSSCRADASKAKNKSRCQRLCTTGSAHSRLRAGDGRTWPSELRCWTSSVRSGLRPRRSTRARVVGAPPAEAAGAAAAGLDIRLRCSGRACEWGIVAGRWKRASEEVWQRGMGVESRSSVSSLTLLGACGGAGGDREEGVTDPESEVAVVEHAGRGHLGVADRGLAKEREEDWDSLLSERRASRGSRIEGEERPVRTVGWGEGKSQADWRSLFPNASARHRRSRHRPSSRVAFAPSLLQADSFRRVN